MSLRLERPEVIQSISRSGTCPIHYGDPSDARRHLLEQLHPLSGHGSWNVSKPSGVATWTDQANDKAIAHRIGNDQEYHRLCACLVEESGSRRRAAADNDIRPQDHELLGCSSQYAKIAGGPPFINLHAAAWNEAELLKSVAERSHLSLRFGIIIKIRNEHADPWNALVLLRARHHRPRSRAADQRDELAPLHYSMTSSASASRDGGMSRSMAFAVARLITRSNF